MCTHKKDATCNTSVRWVSDFFNTHWFWYLKNPEPKTCWFRVFEKLQRIIRFDERTSKDLAVLSRYLVLEFD
jgi:hypothetical protein